MLLCAAEAQPPVRRAQQLPSRRKHPRHFLLQMRQWPQLRDGGSTTLSLGSCLLCHHAARRARRDFLHHRDIKSYLFIFLSSALELVTARSWSVHKTLRVLEKTPSRFHGKGKDAVLSVESHGWKFGGFWYGTAVICPSGMKVY